MAISIGVSLLSSLLAPKPKKVANDNQPTSAFGADIPRIFGIARIPTTVIYSAKVKQKRKGKGGGFGKGNNKKYFGNFAAIIGEGERPFNRHLMTAGTGKLTLRRIFLNDKIWVDYTQQATPDLRSDTTKREDFFEFYNGSLTQGQDPTLVSRLGALNVSSFRGLSYIVFTNLELTDFGGNYPTVKIEVVADIPPTFEEITRDIMFRVGRKKMRPLCEFSDYTFDTVSAPPPVVIDGYILSQDVSDYRTEVSNLMQVFQRMPVEVGNAWAFGPPRPTSASVFLQRSYQPTWVFTSSAGLPASSPQLRTGASTALYTIPQPYTHEYRDADKFPTEMHLSYIQPRLDFEREVVVASRASQGLGDTMSISMNAVIQNRNTASNIAIYLIREGWNRVNHINYTTQDTAVLGRNHIIGGSSTPAVMTAKVETGADGRSRVTGIISGAAQQHDIGENAVSINTYGANPETGPEEIIWTEGQSIDGAKTKSALVILSPRVGRLDSGASAPVLMSTTGGASYIDINATLTPNSYKVPLSGTLKRTPDLGIIDTATELTIVVPTGIQLTSITQEQLWTKTRNLLYIENLGMLSFQNAVATATNTYKLTNLHWGIDANDRDQLAIGNSHTIIPAFGWLMTASPYAVELPVTPPVDITLGVFDAAGAALSSFTQRFQNLGQMPRPPIESYHTILNNGDLVVTWAPGVGQISGTPSILFEDNVDEASSYSIYVYSYNKSTKVFTPILPVITTPSASPYTFSAATVDSWGIPRANIATVVTATNSVGVAQPFPDIEAAHTTAKYVP